MTPLRPSLTRSPALPSLSARLYRWRWALGSLLLLTGAALSVHANEDPPKPRVIAPNELRTRAELEKEALKGAPAKITTEQLKETIEKSQGKSKNVQLVTSEPDKKAAPAAAAAAPAGHGAPIARTTAPVIHRLEDPAPQPVMNPAASRQYIRARAAALTGHSVAPESGGHAEIHWAYEGEGGPQAWGRLNPDYATCASGKRQSPINIEDANTLQGPAEPLQINYRPSNGTVVNNGHTIQVDVDRGNLLTVRGSTYELLQFHFHQPSEERINYRAYAMVAHLVHKNAEGQLAVLAVLIEPGAASSLMQKVWTYIPLEAGDKVRMPAEWVDLNELLPKDMRYYQFMGSLTTPPCTEGVLWMVLKQPVTAAREQIKLFSQLFPNNARPVQSTNGRVIRNAQ